MTSSLQATKPAATKPVIHFGPCELRLDTRELLLGGTPQPVRRRVFDLIVYLVSQRPRAVPHAEVLRAVWQRAGVSPKMLARAVMEARRACGDPADEPRLFVTAHGVGYRFAGAVTEGPAGLEGGLPAEDAGVAEVHDLMQQYEEAYRADDLERAQFLAERALVQAARSQSQTERVRVLVKCSALAMRRGTAAAAGKLAAQALQIARGEGHPTLVAQARVAVGFVHLSAGDRGVAVRHFQESRAALSAPGHEEELLRCMSLLAGAFRDMGNPETALQLCRDNLALARRVGNEKYVIIERTNEVAYLQRRGESQASEGRAAQAQATFEETLRLADALLGDIPESSRVFGRRSTLMNRAIALEQLGRLDEAWATFAEVEQELDRTKPVSGPIDIERRHHNRLLRAKLLARSGRHDEALKELRADIAAAQDLNQQAWLPQLYGMVSDIARRAGLLEQALDAARLQMEAHVAMQASEATTLTRLLEAELNVDELQEALERARTRIAGLLDENAELRHRASLMRGVVPVSAATGLAGREHLGAVFSASHRHAGARGLPMCLGLLELVNMPALRSAHAAEVAQALLRRAADVLGAHADIAHPAVELGPSQLAFHIRDAGPTRAAAVCEAVLEQLGRQDWGLIGLDLEPAWCCTSADAAASPSVEICVQQLGARAPARHRVEEEPSQRNELGVR